MVERGLGAQVRRRLPADANDPADRDDYRAALRRRAGRRRTSDRKRIAERAPSGLLRELEHLLSENGRRRRDAIHLAQAVRAGQRFRRRQPAAGPPGVPATSRFPGGPLPQPPPRIGSRGCAGKGNATSPTGCANSRRTVASRFSRSALSSGRCFLADAVVETHDRIVGWTHRTAACAALRSFAELGSALLGAREAGAARDAVSADISDGVSETSSDGCCAHHPGRVGPIEPRVGGLQPLPPLHAAHAAHAGYRGVARGWAVAGSRRRPAQGRHGAVDRLPAAEFEVEPAAAHPTGPPPAGDGGVVPPARRVPRRRPLLAGAVAPLRRHQEDAAVGPRRRWRRPEPAGPASPHDWLAERKFALGEGCTGWTPRREPARSRAPASTMAGSASKGPSRRAGRGRRPRR